MVQQQSFVRLHSLGMDNATLTSTKHGTVLMAVIVVPQHVSVINTLVVIARMMTFIYKYFGFPNCKDHGNGHTSCWKLLTDFVGMNKNL
jgi:hypothetical protein